MSRNYKVYVHINKINGKRYYGITSRKVEYRWVNGKGYQKQPYFWNEINKYGWDNFTHEVLFNNLTKDEAEWLEKMYIALYDTTDGEKGYNISFGYTQKGCKRTEEQRKHISEGHKKRIYCVELDMVFDSITQASKHVGCNGDNISHCLKGRYKTCGGYHWVYDEDVEKERVS